MPRYVAGRVHEEIAEALDEVERGDCKRLVITVPPQHGKTELASVRFTSLALAKNPARRIILTSYSAERAEYVNGQAREVARGDEFRELFPHLRLDTRSQAQTLWRFQGYSGYIKAVGQGGPLTGFGADLMVIDDPIKDREAAESELQRQKLWDWYTSVAYTRLAPDAAIVVIHTRWHEDDLIGRLLEHSKTQGADQWKVLHYNALASDKEGDERIPLWPERYSLSDYERIRTTVGPRDWEALYQGRPAPPEGNLIKRDWFAPCDGPPWANLRYVRYWDVATSEKTSSDPTAGVKMGIEPTIGTPYIDDIKRVRMDWPDAKELIVQTALEDGRDVLIAVEEVGFQATAIQELKRDRRLEGYAIIGHKVHKDKITRCLAFAARASHTGVFMKRAPWNDGFLHEATIFPNGTHDDQIDGCSGGFQVLLDTQPRDDELEERIYRPNSWEALEIMARDQYPDQRPRW